MQSAMMLVRWRGPFSFEEACDEDGAGLYLCWGRNRRGPAPAAGKLLYCGISEASGGVGSRIEQHADREFNHPDNDWWVGQVTHPIRSTRAHLEAAEWMVVRFTGTEHNWSKSRSEPRFSAYLINEWYTLDDKPRRNHKGVVGAVADVLGWDAEEERLRMAERLVLRPN